MRRFFTSILIITCFMALFLFCFAPALFLGRQFGFRDSAHYYYPLNQRVQEEWNHGRWPLWEPEENAGMPLMGNPTAAVLYPGKLVFAVLPYAWGARIYIVAHTALAFLGVLVLMRTWGTTWFGSALSALAYAFGAPILFQYCNIIYLVGAAWLPLGVRGADQWVRLGKRSGLLELAVVLSMQVLGGDPQAAYLLGLASMGYALGLSWSRARSRAPSQQLGSDDANPSSARFWKAVVLAAVALVGWCVVTLVLAQWFPKLRATGKPTPPLFWMAWVPLIVAAVWALAGLVLVVYWLVDWWKRGRRSPLCFMWLGLVASAALAFALTAAQLLPVIEFTQRTVRAAEAGAHDIYPFGIEPWRLLELAWPNIFGTQFHGNNYWAEVIHVPGARPKPWVPSHYLGGLTLVLALSSMTLRHGPPWRVWFTVVIMVSVLGSFGRYTSPIWVTRMLTETSNSPVLRKLLPDLGPIDPIDDTPIRQDRYLRDGDGSLYWCFTNALPGFGQFRFPAKLFTFATLGFAILAGLGWDGVVTRKGRGATALFAILFLLTVTALAEVVVQRDPIMALFRNMKSQSLMGPLDARGGYLTIVQSLGQAACVFLVGLMLTFIAGKRPQLAGAVALILTTGDLAAANARFVLTVPQSLFETKPEVLKIIEDAERDHPSRGPFRIHRMPLWDPPGWFQTASRERYYEMAMWEHNTIQPKYGINLGVEYTHTVGVGELYDYEWYFNGWRWKLRDPGLAESLGIELGKEIIYYPRHAFDLWNTRYFIVPFFAAGWTVDDRGYAAFTFESDQIYPPPNQFTVGDNNDWVRTQDFRIIRNRQEFPRAWVVHDARGTIPFTGLDRASRHEAMQEMLYAADPIWTNEMHRVYDPRRLAWVGSDDLEHVRGGLSGKATRASEGVKVTYPNPQQAVLDVTLESPGLVVLADIFYPGWALTIDGTPAPIYRVNGVMRGALVSSGHHRLVYTYEPRSFQVGLRMSIAGLAAFLILGVFCTRWPIDPVLAQTS